MNQLFRISYFITILLLSSCNSFGQEKEVVVSKFDEILDSLNVKGAILVYDVSNKTYYCNDFPWAKTRIIPASTFKIPNSIIALETGVVKNDSVVFKWDGEKRNNELWEQDLTFKKAFQVSCVPCYQEIARKIGVKRMKAYLKKLDYNNMVFDSVTIDNFWLQGESKISQMQQIEFLQRLYFSKLPISKRTESIIKNIMVIEKTGNYTLSGKRGWGMRNGTDTGWLVGYFETKNGVFFFATNIEPQKDTNMDEFGAMRLNATKEGLRSLEML